MELFHLPDELRKQEGAEENGMRTLQMGALAGSERIYVNVDVIAPGAYSAKFHSHSRQEEFFLILSGVGRLRTDGGWRGVKAGDFFAKPCGFGNPHQFQNTDGEPLVILDLGSQQAGDVAYYPDEDVYLFRGGGPAVSGQAVAGFTSDPNAPPDV